MNHATTEVFFDDLRVPAENLVGEEGMGFRYILSGMNAERILIGAECIGDAKWLIEKATHYAKERSVFGRPIGQNQGIQFPIAKAYAQMRAAELMVHEAASLYEQGKDCGAEANMAKMLAPTRPGRRPTCACRRTAASASPRNSTSSASFARRGFTRRADLDQPDPVVPGRARAGAAAVILTGHSGAPRSGEPGTHNRRACDIVRVVVMGPGSRHSASQARVTRLWLARDDRREKMTLPLEGLLVVSLEQAVAAPTCSCRLADAGARVIKIERPRATSRAAMIRSRAARAPISSGSTAARSRSFST